MAMSSPRSVAQWTTLWLIAYYSYSWQKASRTKEYLHLFVIRLEFKLSCVIAGKPVISDLAWSKVYKNEDRKLYDQFKEDKVLSKQAMEEGVTRDKVIAKFIKDGRLPANYQVRNP